MRMPFTNEEIGLQEDEAVLVDIQSGYAINVPFSVQFPPGWEDSKHYLDLAQRIRLLRSKEGIQVDDALPHDNRSTQ